MQTETIKTFSSAWKPFGFLNRLKPCLYYFPSKLFPPVTGKVKL